MTELEKLAHWHTEQAVLCAFRDDDTAVIHTAAAATIRAAMGEIERLREGLFLSIQKHEGCDNIECVDTFSEHCHCRDTYCAALKAPAHD